VATLSGTFADAGTLDENTVTVDWGDGTVQNVTLAVGDRAFSLTHQYLDDGLTPGGAPSFSYTIDVTVADDDTGSVNTQTAVTVNNVAPVVAITGVPASSDEGTPINLTASITDPGTLDTFNYDWVVLKNGLPFAALNIDNVSSFTFTPDDNATYDITLTVTDDDTGVGVANATLVVDNVVPTVALTGASTVDEGSLYTLSIGALTDPGNDTPTSFRVIWGDGTFDVLTPAQLALMSGQVTHTYLDGPGGVTQVSVEITDEDGVHANAGVLSLTVNNVDPFGSFTNGGPVNAGTDGFVTWFGQGDASPIDATSLTYDYDFGNDGTFEITNSGVGFATVPGALLTTPGTFDVRSILRDKDGGFIDLVTTITIDPVSFRVLSFTPNASGFDAVLSGDLDLSVFNLYDGFDAPVESTDLFLVDAVGEISGSAVFDAATNTLSFVKTGGVLAAGNYTVFFVSGSSAFREAGTGVLLDGNADNVPGDNFISNFTINASADRVLSLPDFARGPGQTVDVPATGLGLPVTLDDATGVNAIDFDILFDPSLLNITGASLGATLPGDWSITTNMIAPGQFKVTISGVTTLSGTDLQVVNLTADVPASADFGAAQVIRIENLAVNGGLIGSVADQALHKAAYLADVDGDFLFSGLDAALISGVVVDLVTGFDAFDKTDPVILANSTGTGTVNGLDASFVAQKSVALPRPEIPDLPAIAPAGVPGDDPVFTVATSIPATVPLTVDVPITIDDADGLLGFNIDIAYDTAVFDLNNLDISLGTLLTGAGGWSVVPNVDDANGIAKLAFFRAGNLMPAGGGEVAVIGFDILPSSFGESAIDISGPTDLGGKTFNYVDGSVNIGALVGDLNLDGFVGIDDLNLVLGNWNQNVTPGDLSAGDPSGDGFVGIVDLNIVLGNWNAGVPPTTTAAVTSSTASESLQADTSQSTPAAVEQPTATTATADSTTADESLQTTTTPVIPETDDQPTATTTAAASSTAGDSRQAATAQGLIATNDTTPARSTDRRPAQSQPASVLLDVDLSRRQAAAAWQARSDTAVTRASAFQTDNAAYTPALGLWEEGGDSDDA
jgi:Cohesin domain